MTSTKSPRETLSQADADKVRVLVLRLGALDAARVLGIHVRTLHKALARVEVHRLTASVIHERLLSRI